MATRSPHLWRAFEAMCGSLLLATMSLPSLAAEQITFSHGFLERTVSVTSLEAFAKEGQVSDELDFYLQRVGVEEREKIQKILLTPVDLSPVVLSNFLYSSLGEVLLQYLGSLIQTDSRLNGFYALRSAIVQAAADSEGLTILNVIQHFPTRAVRIDGSRVFQIAGMIAQLFERTEQVVALIEKQAELELATTAAINFTQDSNLEEAGPFTWSSKSLNVYDQGRDRRIAANLYQPQTSSSTPVPVIVISHGVGADRNSFTDLAEHLASHGFSVVLLDNRGFNTQKLQNLFRGVASEVIDPKEFIEAPKDVSFLLDKLEQLNESSPSQSIRLNLEEVGIIGHSFGGSMAFALAGAEFNIEQLKANCTLASDGLDLVNLSLLLQCTALKLEDTAFQQLQDGRIKAVFAMNSMGSSLFGTHGFQQMQVPVMFVAGSHDLLAPALLEQIRPFTWLEGIDKYLMVIQAGTHIYAASEVSIHENLTLPSGLAGPDPVLARQYLKVSSLAFMQTYVADQDEYLPYLSAGYAQAISRPPLELMLVRDFPSADLSFIE